VRRPAEKSAFPPLAGTGKRPWSHTIAIQALLQRLSLLAELELPCAVQFGTFGRNHDGDGPIRQCRCNGGRFNLSGEAFDLQLNAATIDSVRVVNSAAGGPRSTCIEILSAKGHVIVRIKGTSDRSSAAVWQDIMDTFDCA
jgi:putative heme degradation protein